MSLNPKETTYHYTPLTEPDAIRLIELQPCPDVSAQVHCKLIHTTLKRAREEIIDHYTALSYVWGDPDNRTPIFIDRHRIHVTKNLDDALRHIRDPTRILYIWADAVCINQNDTTERNHQVAQMGEIYKAAHHTVVFLGTCDTETEFALSHEAKNNFRQQSIEVEPNKVFARAITSLLSRPWFYRVWIFQELALSHDARVQCGHFRCSWDEFYMLAINLQEKKSDLSFLWPRSQYQHLEMLKSMQSAREYCRAMKYEDQPPHGQEAWTKLFEILQSRRGFGVSDDRDMIFAHLGLFSKDMLEVDYGLSTVEVFERIALSYIRVHQSLDVLRYCEDVDPSKRRQGLASWAPDWSINTSYSSVLLKQPSSVQKVSRLTFLQSPSLICSTACTISTITSLSHRLEDITIPAGIDNIASPTHWFQSKYQWWIHYLADIPRLLPAIPRWQNESAPFNLHMSLNNPHNDSFVNTGGPFVLNELMLKQSSTPSIIDGRKLARLSVADPPPFNASLIPRDCYLGIVPGCARVGDKICELPAGGIEVVIRDKAEFSDEKLDSRVRVKMKEPEGSKRYVRHVQLIGQCNVDYRHSGIRPLETDLVYKGKKLLEDDDLLAIH